MNHVASLSWAPSFEKVKAIGRKSRGNSREAGDSSCLAMGEVGTILHCCTFTADLWSFGSYEVLGAELKELKGFQN